jgi:hypothetical protein
METDNIVNEELSVSIVNYFFYFFLCIPLFFSQNFLIDPTMIFILPFLFTFVHFSLMVWYRRKEHLFVSTFISTVNFLFQSDVYKEKIQDTYYKNKRTNVFLLISKDVRSLILLIFLYIVYIVASLRNSIGGKYVIKERLLDPPIPRIKNATLLFITVIVYIAYLYVSFVYRIDQLYWIFVLLFIVGLLSKIIYDKKDESQPGSMRLLSLCITVCIFIYIRHLVLGYPIISILN